MLEKLTRGIFGVRLQVDRARPKTKSTSPFMHDIHMQVVREMGIEPLSLRSILRHAAVGVWINQAVLFDSPANGTGLGNHWRIKELDIQRGAAVLVASSPLGHIDTQSPQSFSVSLDEPFFTGVSITTETSDDIYWSKGFKDQLEIPDDHCINP